MEEPENAAIRSNCPTARVNSRKIGTPMGTVMKMAWATEPVSMPRRTLTLLKARVVAAIMANNPPSIDQPRCPDRALTARSWAAAQMTPSQD